MLLAWLAAGAAGCHWPIPDPLWWAWGLALGLFALAFGVRGAPGRSPAPAEASASGETPPVVRPETRPDEIEHLSDLLEELGRLQNSQDLLERYRCFIHLAEGCLQQSLGPCGISLWCPDHAYRDLVECVIQPTLTGASRPGISRAARSIERSPCRVALDSVVIRDVLKTGQAYGGFAADRIALLAGQTPDSSLAFDACIPLYRPYGQPLLILAECTETRRQSATAGAFERTVRMIRFFWKQLQAANQRQWLADHDEASGSLREEVFLAQGQAWADECRRRDELFVVAVLSVRGFRRMFAGESARWRRLSGLIGRCLRTTLAEYSERFLLGKMADDVFAWLIPGSDGFLWRCRMEGFLKRLESEIVQAGAADKPAVPAVELQWHLGDHRGYRGDLEALLNEIYRRMFCPLPQEVPPVHRLALSRAQEDVAPCR
ncbi:MAG: hypothetical protein JW810_01755 [Sedimentisphaerales bacterium]|nr:hypothetical protein [Sedimentisphaerales bacterium]